MIQMIYYNDIKIISNLIAGIGQNGVHMEENKKSKGIVEKEIVKKRGALALILLILGFAADIAAFVVSLMLLNGKSYMSGGILIGGSIVVCVVLIVICCGLHIVNPNEAMVFTLFGNYYGTIKAPGFYFLNPFVSAVNPAGKKNVTTVSSNGVAAAVYKEKKISTKVMTLNNEKQKVNDVLGNPIIIGAVVIWRVKDPTQAVFQVENYKRYLSAQCDSTIRNIARLYPYDVVDEDEAGDKDEKTLRGSSLMIAECMTKELQDRVKDAGLEVMEVRITDLSYAEEIAAAMLQRQQAVAVIAARKKIVEGAVSMVKMAIDELGEEEIVVLDEERKAAMVSNLLVVLCGNKDAQPIINSGSIY